MKTIKQLAAVLVITAALVMQSQAQPFLTNGLVAYYPFSGNANDASSNGNNGTLFGTATFGVDRFGNSNACLSLSGAASGVDIPSLSNSTYQPLTYSAWFWINSYNGTMTLMGREECGDTTQGAICIYSQPGVATNQLVYYGGGANDGSFSQTVPPTKQWCEMVFTIDQSGNPNFYFNGTNVSLMGSPQPGTPLDFRIGASAAGGCSPGGRYFWNGLIDDVRVYNRALSASEVQELYLYESQPEPCIPHPATASATVESGFVVEATITDSGCGFTNAPLVLIEGGGGTGAGAIAVISNGMVANIVITNAGINYTSVPAIIIGGPPSIESQPQSVAVDADKPASFTVTANGSPTPNYQWAFDGTNIAGATSDSLIISNVVQTNLGTYSVILSNVFGTVSSSNAVLSMYPYLATPFGGLDTLWGYTNTLNVVAWGSGPLSYQWFDDGAPIENATNQSLTFSGILPSNSGIYTVVVSNALGSVTNAPEQVVVEPAGISMAFFPSIIINGVAGNNYVIQRTTTLSNTNSWMTVTNLTLTQATQIWTDYSVDATQPGNPQQFYKVLPGQ